jgi:dipeptidyl aminopeptidase/acylaminoacyl peptidase
MEASPPRTLRRVDHGVAEQDEVCISGYSYGGYATLVGLTLTPDVFACGVDIVGPSSLVTLFESIPPYWREGAIKFRQRVGDWSTPEGRQALLDVSPLTHVARITKPLLIGHGANDPRAKRSESDQIVAAMQAKGIPVSYVVFPDEGHFFNRPENNRAFFAVAEAFLSVHIGGWYQPIDDAEIAASSMVVEAGRQWLPGLRELDPDEPGED